ncbi:tubby C-terminal domain-like protein [Lysinibacillus sp. LZ02]|uniref:tubby C-terminal domain-like protein n=1 Tax=Lysinibacillus sp. LZ02 TaxID=3420668 RepID=UPI003D36417F
MNVFTYEVPARLNATEDIPILEAGQHAFTLNRVYDNGLKKLLDGYFDYRYFLKYVVKTTEDNAVFMCRKVQRKGRLWYEATDYRTNETYVINYENWRIGVPELFVKGTALEMKIDKAMEDWSAFLISDTLVARWLPVYDEVSDTFHMTLEIMPESPVQDAAFFLAIAQVTLFIGA